MVVSEPSPCLRAANQRLLELRAQAQARRLAASSPDQTSRAVAGCLPWVEPETPPVSEQLRQLPAVLPDHLGWGSEALSRVLRQVAARQLAPPAPAPETPSLDSEPQPLQQPQQQQQTVALPTDIKLYPDIGLAMLRQEQTAAGRLWLLLRGLDKEGRGCFRIVNARRLLSKKSTKTYLCGWRQLRNLLKEGDGLYWQRDKTRIWLRSAAKVAYGLGVARLSGRPVALSLEALVNGIGRFRAELYAAFHSGRVKVTPSGTVAALPIARETLSSLSGVGETTQRRYETAVNLNVEANYAIGNKVNKEELEEKGWAQGQALFVLEDFNGQQGPKGRQYVAWQLPNSYTGSHQQCPQGRQRRINRQLKDLVMKGMPGNESEAAEAARATKLYYPNGKLAAQAFNRRKVASCYWQQGGDGNGRYALWHHLEQKQRGRVTNHV